MTTLLLFVCLFCTIYLGAIQRKPHDPSGQQVIIYRMINIATQMYGQYGGHWLHDIGSVTLEYSFSGIHVTRKMVVYVLIILGFITWLLK